MQRTSVREAGVSSFGKNEFFEKYSFSQKHWTKISLFIFDKKKIINHTSYDSFFLNDCTLNTSLIFTSVLNTSLTDYKKYINIICIFILYIY